VQDYLHPGRKEDSEESVKRLGTKKWHRGQSFENCKKKKGSLNNNTGEILLKAEKGIHTNKKGVGGSQEGKRIRGFGK